MRFAFLFTVLLFFIVKAYAKKHHGTVCTFNGKYKCSPLTRHLQEKISLPPNSCILHNCAHCIKSYQTYILTETFELLEPTDFILRPDPVIRDDESTTYNCFGSQKQSCDCSDDVCTGSADFCKIRKCINNSTCVCQLTHNQLTLIAVFDDRTLTNPVMISLQVCLIDKNIVEGRRVLHRKLLEGEIAVFKNNNLTIKFQDPILSLPDLGKVILRSPDFEHVVTVPQDQMIKVPFEYLAYKTIIQVIYLHPSGQTVSGEINVAGKTICQVRQCILCIDFIRHFRCFPLTLQYVFFGLLFIFSLLLIYCIKIILKSILYIVKSIIFVFFALFRILKCIARVSLLLGALIGNTIYDLIQSFYNFLENQTNRGGNIPSLPLVLLALSLLLTNVNGECNSHSIVSSDLKACDILQDGSKMCQMFTTAEITLNTLSAENCILFTDKNDNQLFSLRLKLESVSCKFNTERMYFTFPVTAKHISQISCAFNEYCGRGAHCVKERIGKAGLRFEGETKQSLEFPGISSCVPGGIGVGCTILTRASCNFHRTWYEPDLLHSYEVSKIRGHTCQYHIAVRHLENNTVSRVAVSDSVYTNKGVKITVLGAFDMPQLYIDEFFIQRTGRPNEAYLAPASQRNHPKAGEIGAIQANTSYTKNFIFDPLLTKCDFFEDRLRCVTAPDALELLRTSKQHALPLQRDIHLLKVEDEKLTSTLLLSSAVRVQLHFDNYKISVQTVTVCPQFDENIIQAMGCYSCQVLARITFKAHSTCQGGMVTVQFQELSTYTRAVELTKEPREIIIKFLADSKCYNEKICLKAQTLIQCKSIKFCLNEPSVELRQLNLNYTNIISSSTYSNWWDALRIPNLSSSFFLLKFAGSVLFIICLFITTLSTMLTCCGRRR